MGGWHSDGGAAGCGVESLPLPILCTCKQCTTVLKQSLQTAMRRMPSAYGIVILRTRSSERRRSLGKVGRVVSVRRSIATRYVQQPRSAHTYMTIIASYGLSISLSAKACARMLKRCGQKRTVNGCGQPENSGGWELSFTCWHRLMTPSPTHRPGDTNKTSIVVGWIIQYQPTFTQCS